MLNNYSSTDCTSTKLTSYIINELTEFLKVNPIGSEPPGP
jgi:hypothetical protein